MKLLMKKNLRLKLKNISAKSDQIVMSNKMLIIKEIIEIKIAIIEEIKIKDVRTIMKNNKTTLIKAIDVNIATTDLKIKKMNLENKMLEIMKNVVNKIIDTETKIMMAIMKRNHIITIEIVTIMIKVTRKEEDIVIIVTIMMIKMSIDKIKFKIVNQDKIEVETDNINNIIIKTIKMIIIMMNNQDHVDKAIEIMKIIKTVLVVNMITTKIDIVIIKMTIKNLIQEMLKMDRNVTIDQEVTIDPIVEKKKIMKDPQENLNLKKVEQLLVEISEVVVIKQ